MYLAVDHKSSELRWRKRIVADSFRWFWFLGEWDFRMRVIYTQKFLSERYLVLYHLPVALMNICDKKSLNRTKEAACKIACLHAEFGIFVLISNGLTISYSL